eukprot:3681134-Rhodomonas_salina.1
MSRVQHFEQLGAQRRGGGARGWSEGARGRKEGVWSRGKGKGAVTCAVTWSRAGNGKCVHTCV